MRLSDWINNIRWKYFTNNKSGLIFKELTKEFRIVYKMTENKRYFKREWEEEYYIFDSKEISEEKVDEEIEYGYEIFADSMQGDKVVNKLNEQEETIKKQYQEIISCHDTLVTIEALCDAVLNHDFEGVVSKVDFCNMLIEMDNKDLAFLKDCFEAIKDNDLKTMTSLTVECKYGGDVND